MSNMIFFKLTIKIIGIVLLIFNTWIYSNKINAQVLFENNITIEPYYGFPNFGQAYHEIILYETNYDSDIKIGPWGVKIEYMAQENIGITLDAMHNSFESLNRRVYESFDDDGNIIYSTHYHSTKSDRLRVQLGINYHFETSIRNIDSYMGIALGSNHRRIKYDYDNDPFYIDMNEYEMVTILPLSMRMRYGARYFLTDNIGINGEIGMGGPLISIGLTIRFLSTPYLQ